MARTGDEWGWTVPRVARAGDEVFFYLLNPEGSFVAVGQVMSDPEPGTSKEGDGDFVADVGMVRMLPHPLPRLDVVDLVPAWGWPRQPHTATTVPQDQVSGLKGVLGI